MFVASVRAMWLCEILLALSASNPILSITTRPAACPTIVALATLALTLQPLLPLMTVLTLLAVGTIATVMA